MSDPTETAESARFERAIVRFDAAHAADPDHETVDGREQPKELVYAKRMSAMLARYAPEAPEIVRPAARCQHIERWKIPRGEYAMDRIGYLQWRKRLNKFHAEVAGNILREVGDDEATIGRVAMLLRKEALKTDAEAQMLEDIVDLVFLESYLAGFVATHDRYDIAKFRDILAKMAKKMSACGRAAALTRETRAARTRAADRGRDGGSGKRLVAVTVHRSALSGSPMPLSRGASACRDDACMDAASDL